MSSVRFVDAQSSASGRSLRVRDVAMLVPAVALGVLLLAVHQADRTGSPLSQVLSPSSLASLVPAAFENHTPTTP